MNTYQIAKGIYTDMQQMKEGIFNIPAKDIPTFRKHLTEFEYRKREGRKFITKILGKGRILVKRIE